jgi:hypothetical protein
MKIKISQSPLLFNSGNVFTIINSSKKEGLINTIYEGLPEGENHFSICVPWKRWIQIRCTHNCMELVIYKNLGGHGITVNS